MSEPASRGWLWIVRKVRKAVALSAVASLLFGIAPGVAAPVKKRPAASAKAPVAKVSNSEWLARQVVLSRLDPSEPLAAPCSRTKFQYLATAMAANEDMLSSRKREFETEAEYQDRADKISGVMAKDSVVFCEPLNDNPDLSFTYDTASHQFKGSFAREHNVWRDTKSLGSYKSRTRMGAAAIVKASVEWEYNINLTINEVQASCLKAGYGQADFQAPVAIDSAPSVKFAGRFVYVVRLIHPYVETSETPGNPTLDDPYDVYTKTTTVFARLEAVAIVDGTGATVWKCVVDRLDPNRPAIPMGLPDDWVRFSDYPVAWYSSRLRGRVRGKISVGSDGKPAACKVVGSSGSTVLDEATCAAWMKRMSFMPATDDAGRPTTGEFTAQKDWP